MALYENVRDWLLTPGDPGPLPVTKFGGVPWWPQYTPRPVCPAGHDMGFIAQVRLADVPGWESDPGLLSFHYCYECQWQGEMAWGWSMPENKGYAVTIFDTTQPLETDDKGVMGTSECKPYAVHFYDYALPILRPKHDEAWYAILEPEDAEAMREDTEQEKENFALRQRYGLVRSGALPSATPRPDVSEEGVYRPDGAEFVPGYGNRSRLSGPPTWVQNAEFPTNAAGEPLLFVAQLDWVLGESAGWGGGGYAYLFVDPADRAPRTGELVVLTT